VEAGHGSAVEEVVMTSDDKQKTRYYYYYLAYEPRDATDVMTSWVGIDGPGQENGRVTSRPCTQVAEVGRRPKRRSSDTTDRLLDYYSRVEHLAETK